MVGYRPPIRRLEGVCVCVCGRGFPKLVEHLTGNTGSLMVHQINYSVKFCCQINSFFQLKVILKSVTQMSFVTSYTYATLYILSACSLSKFVVIISCRDQDKHSQAGLFGLQTHQFVARLQQLASYTLLLYTEKSCVNFCHIHIVDEDFKQNIKKLNTTPEDSAA